MLDFQKILQHPNKDEIITKLTSGDSVREVCEWLKASYPNNKQNQIGFTLLDKFKREHLNITGNLIDDLKQKIKEQKIEEANANIKQIVRQNKTYEEKQLELINTKIDYKYKLCKFLDIVETRFGQLYDITQNNTNNYKPDKAMREWMELMLKFVTEIRKVDGAPDQIIQHNVAFQSTIDEQIAIIQRAIIQTFEELPLGEASVLIEKFNTNMKNLKAQKEAQLIYTDKDMHKIDGIIAKMLPSGDE